METCNTIEIGKRIKELREARDLTQAELAKELSKQLGYAIKRETVNYWENGTRDLKTEYTVILAEFFGETCDYILRGVQAENIDVHEKTGLSDHAIRNLINFKNNNRDWTGTEIAILNLLLQRSDFYDLISDINWTRIDRINKIIYENDEVNRSEGIYGSRVYGSNIVLDPRAFYKFNIAELKEYFIEVIEAIIDDSIRDKSVGDLIKEKELLINKFESVLTKEELDVKSDEQREEVIKYLRIKHGYQQ